MKSVVFDIGNVLVAWDPVAAFLPELGSRAAAQAFLDRVGFAAWNAAQDRGRGFAEALAAVPDPADAAILARYPERFALTIADPVPGTWAILDALAVRGLAIHAITNWPAELWPVGLARHPRLGEVFGVTVVSGREGVMKPEPAIFALLCERAGLAPAECLFIDDSAANVAGARAFGMQAHHFAGAAGLAADLAARGLL
jgi:HAD superfamily hydrolase (TIGR01509 family)